MVEQTLKAELQIAKDQIESLESKCKALLIANMALKEENEKLNSQNQG